MLATEAIQRAVRLPADHHIDGWHLHWTLASGTGVGRRELLRRELLRCLAAQLNETGIGARSTSVSTAFWVGMAW